MKQFNKHNFKKFLKKLRTVKLRIYLNQIVFLLVLICKQVSYINYTKLPMNTFKK